MTDRMPGEDPGWGSFRRLALAALVPWLAVRRAETAQNVLVALRSVFVTFATALVLIGVVVLVLTAGDTGDDASVDTPVAVVGAFVIGFASVLGSWTLLRELPCSDLGQLLGTYRSRFFLRIALAESSALLGFVGTFLSESPLPYFAGAVPAAIGFVRLAPTQRNLQREDHALASRGCPHSLYGALLQATAGGPAPG